MFKININQQQTKTSAEDLTRKQDDSILARSNVANKYHNNLTIKPPSNSNKDATGVETKKFTASSDKNVSSNTQNQLGLASNKSQADTENAPLLNVLN